MLILIRYYKSDFMSYSGKRFVIFLPSLRYFLKPFNNGVLPIDFFILFE
jgi:hypothetical protein